MSIDSWADAARLSRYRQDVEQQRAIDTLKTVFEGRADLDSAASMISSIYNPLLKRGFRSSPVTELWGMICEAAKMLGSNREIDERLIGLLNSMSKLPDVADKNGNAINPGNGTSGVYWKDLPGFAIMLREYAIGMFSALYFGPPIPWMTSSSEADIEPETCEMPDEGEWTDSQRATLLNVTTFGALHLAYGRLSMGMPFHAEVSLMEGIEVPYETPKQQRRAVTNVPPAATWILLAGEKLYELCTNDYKREDDKGRGYSLRRWALWKERFREIAENQELKDVVKDVASEAASEMERIAG